MKRSLFIIRPLLALTFLLSLLLPGMPLAPTSAAAAGCSGTGCNGKDPITMGCNADAYTVTSTPIKTMSGQVVGRADLRWSPSCKTNWARAVSSVGSTNMFVQLQYCDGSPVSGTYYQLPNTTSVYGDMRYNTTVRAIGAFGYNGASDIFGVTGCY